VKIDAGAPTPLYQQVANSLRRQIVDGTIAVGDQLPPHRQLATQFGVSVITINKALSGLVSAGVLNSRVGRGTFVAVRPAALPVPTTWHGDIAPATNGRTLGFVLRDLNSPFFSMVANLAEQHAHAQGYGMLVLSSGNVFEREDTQIRRLLEVGVEGLVVVSMSRTTYRLSEALQQLQSRHFPFVMVSYTAGEDVPFVGSDFGRAGTLVGEHFAKLGRKRWGYITDRFGSLSGEARSNGYRRVAREHGLSVDDALVFEYPYEGEWNDYQSGHDLAEYIAHLPERPDAMYVFNDLGALGLIDGLVASGVRVPEDMAVVGFDGIALGARSPIPLTTVQQSVARIAALAVDTVIAQARGENVPTRHIIEPELIVRASCGAAPALRSTDARRAAAAPNQLRPPQSLAEHGRSERARLAKAHVANGHTAVGAHTAARVTEPHP